MDEAERLLEIERLHLLDTPPEPVFDAIVAAARAATGMTMGLITVVADERQWFKANIGLEGVSETAREISFCTHAIRQDELFEIPDARQDPLFHQSTGDRRPAHPPLRRHLRWARARRASARCACSTRCPACCRPRSAN
jgi:GAF domain-containing protein